MFFKPPLDNFSGPFSSRNWNRISNHDFFLVCIGIRNVSTSLHATGTRLNILFFISPKVSRMAFYKSCIFLCCHVTCVMFVDYSKRFT